MSRIWNKKISPYWLGAAILALLFLLAGFLKILASLYPNNFVTRSVNAPSITEPMRKNQTNKYRALTINVGNKYVVNDNTVVCVNDKTCKELDKILLAKDETGFEQFLLYEKGYLLSGGDHVLVLDTNFWREEAKIHVLDGSHAGIVGWLSKKKLSSD